MPNWISWRAEPPPQGLIIGGRCLDLQCVDIIGAVGCAMAQSHPRPSPPLWIVHHPASSLVGGAHKSGRWGGAQYVPESFSTVSMYLCMCRVSMQAGQ